MYLKTGSLGISSEVSMKDFQPLRWLDPIRIRIRNNASEFNGYTCDFKKKVILGSSLVMVQLRHPGDHAGF